MPLSKGQVKKRGAVTNTGGSSFIETVKDEVDVRKLAAKLARLEDVEDFGRYLRARCINPRHTDTEPTMRLYADGVNCPGCDWKADVFDLYFLFNPELAGKWRDAADQLLSGDWKRTGEGEVDRVLRSLDPGIALKHHLLLAETPEAVAGLEAMGFTKKAIRHFKLGYAEVNVRAGRDEQGEPVYERQMRYSVPVWKGQRLLQVLYRKASPEDGGSKITSEKDAGVHLYNQDALEGAEFVVVGAGWGDAIVLWQLGIPAVCSTGGDGHWNAAEWNELLAEVSRIYVVGDRDKSGQKFMDKVRRELPWAKPLYLPGDMGSKQDPRDWYLNGARREDFERLMRGADNRSGWMSGFSLKRGGGGATRKFLRSSRIG